MKTQQNNDGAEGGFLGKIIEYCSNHPFMTLLGVFAFAVWGYYSLQKAPLDAIPDLSDVQVIVYTEWPGRSPDLVEDQITYPISATLLAAPEVKFVRGQSFFGLSFVYAIFEDGTDMYWARSRIMEYLNTAQSKLPEGVTPTLGPDATGVGWVFQYALVDRSGKHDLQQLRSLQDWNVRYALESVPGVAEVASIGGFVKQYQIQIDPNRLLAYDIRLEEVIKAVRDANEEVGGRTIEIAGHEHMIRGRGYVQEKEDLEYVPVGLGEGGTPIYLRDIAEISLGPEMRRGMAELNGEGEVVGGIVIMRYGENALAVINAVKDRIEEVERGLPEGVELVITYDRSELITDAISTLKTTLIEELIVVSVIIFIFLLHVRSALIPIITLPIAVLLAFIPMYFQGLGANIMSLGGIAVTIGAMMDASIIIVENIHKKLEEWDREGRKQQRFQVIVRAMQEVGPSIFFSLLVMTIAFMPVFTLTGTEGRLFRPLAFTYTYSIGFAALLAITLAPALAVLVIRGKIMKEDKNPLNRWLIMAYTPVVRFVVRHRWYVVGGAITIILGTIPIYMQLESEFMPPLNEGAILYMPTSPPGMSVTEASSVLQQMDREIMQFPEVETVFGKIGRARTATDPAPISMVETTIILKDKEHWREGMTWEKLLEEMNEKLRYPGMPNIFWMPIQTRTEMLATGIRSPLGIQVFGDDLETIEKAAVAIEGAVSQIPGTRSAFAERSTGGFFIDFEVKRKEAARYGLSVKEINRIVMTAIGGMNISETVEGRERYPISVRYAREFRDDPEKLKQVLVSTPTGAQIPITQVADITFTTGPPMVRSEDGKLVGFVFVDSGDRPIAEYVEEAKKVVANEVDLPPGVRVGWAGQFKYLERAKEQLSLIVPLTFFIILLLLYTHLQSPIATGIIVMAMPFALVGAVWLLYLLDYNMSVAVWVGLIAMAGLDIETSVVMLLFLRLSHESRKKKGLLRNFSDLTEAIVEGAAQRIRPKVMTVVTTVIALIPILWSTGTGADVMKRIAAPIVGGVMTSFMLELLVIPTMFSIWKGWELKRDLARVESEF